MNHSTRSIRVAIRQQLLLYDRSTIMAISQATGYSFPTIKKQLELMIEAGDVAEDGTVPSNGGRPSIRYVLIPGRSIGLCVYLEKHVLRYRYVDLSGTVIEEGQATIQHDPADQLFSTLTSLQARRPFDALSVGVPAAVSNGRIILMDDYPSLLDLDLRASLERAFHVPIAIENDMNAAVYGLGRITEQSDETLVYIYLGQNGPGAGLLVNGRLIRGASSFTGEIAGLPFYDKQTFAHRIRSKRRHHPLSARELDALARLVTTFCAILNPHRIIFSDVDLTMDDVQAIRDASALYLPLQHIPSLSIGEWEHDYFQGLTRICIGLLLETQENR